jgi:hypothetical protein
MGYFEEMMRRSQRQDARTRNAQLTLEQISGLAPTNAEIAVQAGQAALQHYLGLLDRARAKKAADQSALAKREEAKQAVIDKRKEWLYGKVLDRGGALPEDFAGMPEGYTLPDKPAKPMSVKTIVNRRTGNVYDMSTGKVLYNIGPQPLADNTPMSMLKFKTMRADNEWAKAKSQYDKEWGQYDPVSRMFKGYINEKAINGKNVYRPAAPSVDDYRNKYLTQEEVKYLYQGDGTDQGDSEIIGFDKNGKPIYKR